MRVAVFSDIHYASPGEQARRGHEARATRNPLLRMLVHCYRQYVWLPDPFAHNHLLPAALERCGPVDWVVANGDYSCDTAFVGVCDDAACASVRTVLDQFRSRYGERFVCGLGDHELGKLSLFGGQGGFRLASWRRATGELGIPAFWQQRLGERLVAMGVTSSLWAFASYEEEALPEERGAWCQLRARHLEEVRDAWEQLGPRDRLLLFVHDPTALPYLAAEPWLARRLSQISLTVVGHLHSPLILWCSHRLAGLPTIPFLGNAVRRMSRALRRAQVWRPFNVVLCPSLTGIELVKDGGWLELECATDTGVVTVHRQRLPRGSPAS